MRGKKILYTPEQQAAIKARLKEITKQLRQWPFPKKAPKQEIQALLSELHGIMHLNTKQESCVPVTILDRALTLHTRAYVISTRDWKDKAGTEVTN